MSEWHVPGLVPGGKRRVPQTPIPSDSGGPETHSHRMCCYTWPGFSQNNRLWHGSTIAVPLHFALSCPMEIPYKVCKWQHNLFVSTHVICYKHICLLCFSFACLCLIPELISPSRQLRQRERAFLIFPLFSNEKTHYQFILKNTLFLTEKRDD